MNALTPIDAPTRPRSVVITSTDPAALAELLFGGIETTRAALAAAHRSLAAAEESAARVEQRRTLVGDAGVWWTWGEDFYRRAWPLAQERIARCRAEIARCEGRIRELQE